MKYHAEKDTKNDTNTVVFELKDNVLIVCNNGQPFSIEGIESLMLPYYTSKDQREFKQSFGSTIINDQVCELLEKRRENYLREPERIQSDYKTEYETVGEYHGREILELLQNCIDAMPGDSSFQIGAKGLGFRSLLNWCENIKIYSGELSVAFGLEEAAKFKESLGRNQKVAILSAPTVIDSIETSYTTQIVLGLKTSVIDDVRAQLTQIDERSMVFLPKIEELIIRDAHSERSYQKLEDHNGNVLVSSMIDGTCTEHLWRVFKQEKRIVSFKDIENKEKEYNYGISIAICEDLECLENNCLYSYFKTKVSFPIGWLCHADFELRTDRNDIIEHPLNKLILKELVSLIDESSQKICDSINNPKHAIESIMPTSPFPADIAGFNFTEYYYANIGRKEILPTTNGNFISIYESPWITDEEYPVLFKGNAFSKLLMHFNNSKTRDFIRKLGLRDNLNIDISVQEIQDSINKQSDTWSPDECFTVFEWWRKSFSSCSDALDWLPNLIKLENGKWATGNDRIFFKVGGVPKVPSWVKFSFLSEQFQKAAINFYNNQEEYISFKSRVNETRDIRSISDYVTINNSSLFRYLDRSTTIAQVNMSVGENWDYACEFVQWMYKNYGADTKWTPPAENVYSFPSQNKIVTRPEKLYFGGSYDNELATLLAMQEGQNELLKFPGSDEEKIEFTDFLSKFGVKFTPARDFAVFKSRQIPEDYREALYAYFSYPLQLDGGTAIIDMRKEGVLESLNVDSYMNLIEILNKAKTSDVLLWITKDNFLKNSLMSRFEITNTHPLTAKRKGQLNSRSVPRNQVRNYIAHVFSSSKWIQIGEKRYSPNQILLDEKIGLQFEPRMIGVSVDNIFGDITLEEYEINAIIDNLGFIRDFSKIRSSFLYTILNELSIEGIDQNGELSKKIYAQIMKASTLEAPEETCLERKKFLKTGKVYCFDGEFHNVQEAFYADKSFPDRVREGHILINLRKNQGAKKAEVWFGTKEFRPNVIIRNYTESIFNRQFRDDFHKLLKGLYVENRQSITDEKRWRAVKNMRITLASSVILTYGEIKQHCELYQYAKDNDGQYILMIGDEKPDRFNERLTNILFEIFRTVINIDDPALGSSFRDLWKFPSGKLREALIQRNESESIWQDSDFFFDGIVKSDLNEDVSTKNMALFIKCRDDNYEKFKRILYAKLLSSDIESQKKYLTEIEKYNQIKPPQDSLDGDYCNVLSLLQSIEPANILVESDNEIDVNKIGKETKQKLQDAFPQSVNELNIFLVKEYDSLLRFGNYDFLQAEFKKHLEKKKSEKEEAQLKTPVKITPIFVDPSTLMLSSVQPSPRKKDGPFRNGTTYVDYSSKQVQNVGIGKSAEIIVKDYLIGMYGEDKVKWVSQFAKEENVNLDGSDSTGYDIEYSADNEKFFVEVKTNSSILPTISFHLTSAERAFAEEHNMYQVFVVSAPKSDNPTIIPFQWDDIRSYANTPVDYLVEFVQHNPTDF